MTLAFFSQITHLLTQLPSTESSELLVLVLGESVRLLPYVMGSRKAIRAYLKVIIGLKFRRLYFTDGH
jgi:nucleolar complex protein 2